VNQRHWTKGQATNGLDDAIRYNGRTCVLWHGQTQGRREIRRLLPTPSAAGPRTLAETPEDAPRRYRQSATDGGAPRLVAEIMAS